MFADSKNTKLTMDTGAPVAGADVKTGKVTPPGAGADPNEGKCKGRFWRGAKGKGKGKKGSGKGRKGCFAQNWLPKGKGKGFNMP